MRINVINKGIKQLRREVKDNIVIKDNVLNSNNNKENQKIFRRSLVRILLQHQQNKVI